MNNSAANLEAPRGDPLDEPPPYTPRPDPLQGETTVEYGPSRPFQQAPPRPAPQPQTGPVPGSQQTLLRPRLTGTSSRGVRSLWQQFSDQIDQLANDLERRGSTPSSRLNVPQRTGASWSSYPGRSAPSASAVPPPPIPSRNVPPPLPPRRRTSSTTSLPQTSSEFARDFYAAGTGQGLITESDPENQSSSNRNHAPSNDRSPTTVPTPGRPLLHDGKLLVYPKGHYCEKCHNTGYKHFDPLRPCKKCWTKYGKPFSGPLAYSYSSSATSSNTQSTNLQRPLPGTQQHITGPSPSRLGVPQVSPRPVSYGDPRVVPSQGFPPTGAVIYQPGDPRIGGELCWKCHGKGTMNIFIDIINCPVCGGCGRTFPMRTF